MAKDELREQLSETIQNLHRQIAALEKLGGRRPEIAAYQEAVARLTQLLTTAGE